MNFIGKIIKKVIAFELFFLIIGMILNSVFSVHIPTYFYYLAVFLWVYIAVSTTEHDIQ